MKVEFRVCGKKARVGQKLTQIHNVVKGRFAPEIVKKGYKHAYENAPRAKDNLGGGTKQAIRYVIQDRVSKLKLIQPTKRPAGKGGYRPYHLWMHRIGKYPQIANYIYTGDPQFMEGAFIHMRKEARRKMQKLLK